MIVELPSQLLSRIEAATYLGIQPATLAAWATNKRYRLPMIKVGRLVRYARSDLDRWLESRRSVTSNEYGQSHDVLREISLPSTMRKSAP